VIVEYVFRALVAAQYTGTQASADVLAAVQQISQMTGNTWSVQSDDGAVLLLRETGPSGAYADWPVLAGQVVVIDPGVGIIDRLPAAQFTARYQRFNQVADAVLTRGLNLPTWITALAGKLGIVTR
jgi:hypothetical protein